MQCFSAFFLFLRETLHHRSSQSQHVANGISNFQHVVFSFHVCFCNCCQCYLPPQKKQTFEPQLGTGSNSQIVATQKNYEFPENANANSSHDSNPTSEKKITCQFPSTLPWHPGWTVAGYIQFEENLTTLSPMSWRWVAPNPCPGRMGSFDKSYV